MKNGKRAVLALLFFNKIEARTMDCRHATLRQGFVITLGDSQHLGVIHA